MKPEKIDSAYWLKKYHQASFKIFSGAAEDPDAMAELASMVARQLGGMASNISRNTGRDVADVCSDLACEVADQACFIDLHEADFYGPVERRER